MLFTVLTSFRMQANLNKSSIYCGGVQLEVRQQIIQQLGYKMEKLPFKYLLSTKKLTVIQWYPLIDKIMARINSWTARKLSYAGRIQLGFGYVTKMALVAWERVCCPKSVGGMGLINMQVWNKAAVAKLCWDLANKEDKLWIKWIHIKGQSTWPETKQAS
ncbi:hypothetical protein KY289_021000 [Solanum tuberosum]|nr:hypothetical protein KY289_021000 [Solanum tuberosum]